MASNALSHAVQISGSLNVYSRAKGIADHYWPGAIFSSSSPPLPLCPRLFLKLFDFFLVDEGRLLWYMVGYWTPLNIKRFLRLFYLFQRFLRLGPRLEELGSFGNSNYSVIRQSLRWRHARWTCQANGGENLGHVKLIATAT